MVEPWEGRRPFLFLVWDLPAWPQADRLVRFVGSVAPVGRRAVGQPDCLAGSSPLVAVVVPVGHDLDRGVGRGLAAAPDRDHYRPIPRRYRPLLAGDRRLVAVQARRSCELPRVESGGGTTCWSAQSQSGREPNSNSFL